MIVSRMRGRLRFKKINESGNKERDGIKKNSTAVQVINKGMK